MADPFCSEVMKCYLFLIVNIWEDVSVNFVLYLLCIIEHRFCRQAFDELVDRHMLTVHEGGWNAKKQGH